MGRKIKKQRYYKMRLRINLKPCGSLTSFQKNETVDKAIEMWNRRA